MWIVLLRDGMTQIHTFSIEGIKRNSKNYKPEDKSRKKNREKLVINNSLLPK